MPIATVYMKYDSDNGTEYRRRTFADLRAAVGNVLAAGTEPRLPSQIKPRYLLCRAASGKEHKLVVGSASNAAFIAAGTGSPTTLSVPDPQNRGTGGDNIDVVCNAAVAEKRYNR